MTAIYTLQKLSNGWLVTPNYYPSRGVLEPTYASTLGDAFEVIRKLEKEG